MDDSRRDSLKGLTLEELKRATTTSSPPAFVAYSRRTSEVSDRLNSLQLHSRYRFTPSPRASPSPFTNTLPSPNPSSVPSPLAFSTPRSNNVPFNFSSANMVREQEPSRNPLAPSPANIQHPVKTMDSQTSKLPTSPQATRNVGEPQVSSPQPVFGRPTQLGASQQPFARHQPFQRSGSGTTQTQSGGRTSDGYNHLFITNKSGNQRPNAYKPLATSNPLQSLHRPPPGGNPLSQMSAASQKSTNTNSQPSQNNSRPRNTRIIDSSDDDDDDLVEIPRPTNVPSWQPKPFAHPTFSSAQPTNPYFAPKPSTTVFMTKADTAAHTLADGGIWEDRYNIADPSIYLDSGKANDELKALFEGSIEDEDDKPKTRRRKKQLETKLGELTEKMKSLDVETAKQDQPEEEEDEEDDGTVEGLKVKLLPHQIDGVEWMRTKERGKGKGRGITKGGILADDMGLGKTIQSIALILTNKPPSTNPPKKSETDIEYDKCTLIVAPLALIKQWEGELRDRVESSHAFKICVHHGPQRAKSYKDLRKYDIVITTYQTLSSEHAACSDKIRAGCYGINWYRVILDEAHSIKNRNAKVTKAACGLEAKYRWCLTGTPMQNNLDELQSLIHFLQIGPLDKWDFWKSRITQPMNAGRGGLAIKRLQTALKSLMKRRTKDVLKQDGALKNGSTNNSGKSNDAGFKIVKRTVENVVVEFTREERSFYEKLESRIDANIERMLAGNNKVNYASALVLLLRLRQACNHAKLLGFDLAGERDALGDGTQTPRKKAGADVDDITAMLGGLDVENRKCDICQNDLNQKEVDDGALRCRECEDDLHQQVNIWKPKRSKKELKLVIKTDRKVKRNVIIDSDDEDEEEADNSKSSIKSKTVKVEDSPASSDPEDDDYDSEDDAYDSDTSTPLVASSKIRHLLSILRNDSHTHKYIVFSFFTSMLDLIEPFLRHNRIKYARYDGSMRNDMREASLSSLRDDPTTRVLLCSLRAGSLGLNLTAASRVVILEPFWNPFVEEQAIDRVHRLNQTQDVVVYKLTIKDTVEARILALQERKRELARVTVEGGAGAKGVAKLSMDEMLKLFTHDMENAAQLDMLGFKGKGGEGLLERNGDEWGESTEGVGDGRRRKWVLDPKKAKENEVKEAKRKEHAVYGRRW